MFHGVLETRKPPPPAIVVKIAAACAWVEPAAVTLFAALRSAWREAFRSWPGRSRRPFLTRRAPNSTSRESSRRRAPAPLPPVAKNDLAAIGRTNDSILYGARVILVVRGDDASLKPLAHRYSFIVCLMRSRSEPFAAIFARYNHDFYALLTRT